MPLRLPVRGVGEAIGADLELQHPLPSKTPYRDGTTNVIFEPLDFIAKLAALIPKPRTNRTRFHGVFVPNRKLRVRITPAKRGTGRERHQPGGEHWLEKMPAERHASMIWMHQK